MKGFLDALLGVMSALFELLCKIPPRDGRR